MGDLQDALHARIATFIDRIATVRYALVTATDPIAGAIKVRIMPDGVESGWIPDLPMSIGSCVVYSPTPFGAHVTVTPTEGDPDYPVLSGRIFDATNPPPKTSTTGEPVQAGEFGIILQDGTELLVAPGAVTIHATTLAIVGDVTVTGKVTAQGDVLAGTVSLKNHVTTKVQTGGGVSGPPQQ